MSNPFKLSFDKKIYKRTVSGVDSYGKPSYSTAVEFDGRVERSSQLVKGSDGIQRTLSHKVFTDAQVGIEDLIFLPGDDVSDINQGHKPVYVDEASAIGYEATLIEVGI